MPGVTAGGSRQSGARQRNGGPHQPPPTASFNPNQPNRAGSARTTLCNGSDRHGALDVQRAHDWECDQVADWLLANGFEKYADVMTKEHEIDGKLLLSLTESDLRQPPLQIRVLGDVKRMAQALVELKAAAGGGRSRPVLEADESFDSQEGSEPVLDDRPSSRMQPLVVNNSQLPNEILIHPDFLRVINDIVHSSPDMNISRSLHTRLSQYEKMCQEIESPDSARRAMFKTLVAFVYCFVALLITSITMVIVHDRVPDMAKYPPLPDLVLDNIPLIPWAFEVCEALGVAMGVIWFSILAMHKHKVIIMRRMFSLVGTVFLLRCITMLITSMSVPGVHLQCTAQSYGNMAAKIRQALKIYSGLGMSLQGVRTCGDYMFSGHTTALTLLNHFITEYTPDTWTGLHTATWVMNLFAVFFILAAHEHYSIDVFIAFYISSRLFCYYHAMAQQISTSTDKRTRVWFPFMWFFEAGCPGRLPNEFGNPFEGLGDWLSETWQTAIQFFKPPTPAAAVAAAVKPALDNNKPTNNYAAKRKQKQK